MGFRITIDMVKEKMERGEPIFFIDVRNQSDWESTKTKVKGALRMRTGEEPQHLNEIPRDRLVVTY